MLSPQPIFLPLGCSIIVTKEDSRIEKNLIPWFGNIILRVFSLGIDLKVHKPRALQEEMVIIFPKTSVLYSGKSMYGFSGYRFSCVLWMTTCACPTYLHLILFFQKKAIKSFKRPLKYINLTLFYSHIRIKVRLTV